MSLPEQTEWKNRWLQKGLPETLLDDMITEANAEYDTELGVWFFHRYAKVTVNVLDDELAEDEFYLFIIERADEVFYGHGSIEPTQIFPQVPCTEIVFEVYVLKYTDVLTVQRFGYSIVTVTKDMDVDISVSVVGEPLVAPSTLIGNIAVTYVAQEIPVLTSSMQLTLNTADILLSTITQITVLTVAVA